MGRVRRYGAGVAVVTLVSLFGLGAVSSGQTADDDTSDAGREPAAAPTVLGAPPEQQVAAQAVSDGTLYYSRDDESELYTLSTVDATPTLIGTTGVSSSTVGLTEGPDPAKLIGSTYEEITKINADGSGFEVGPADQMEAEGLAYDAVNGVLYKIINEDFATADQTTGATLVTLTDAPEDLEGLAWRRTDGRIYAIGADSDTLFAYTPGADTWAPVGSTGIANTDAAGLAWDPVSDTFFAVFETGNLYRITPAGVATLIGNTGIEDSGGGLAFIAPPVAAVEITPRFTG